MYHLDQETEALIAKPVAVALSGVLLDRYWTGVSSVPQNLAFGACCGAGVLLADYAGKHLHTHDSIVKNLETRTMELAIVSTGAIALDKFVFKAPLSDYTVWRIATVVMAEMSGEYIANSFLGLV